MNSIMVIPFEVTVLYLYRNGLHNGSLLWVAVLNLSRNVLHNSDSIVGDSNLKSDFIYMFVTVLNMSRNVLHNGASFVTDST